jgi:hypothetical protein
MVASSGLAHKAPVTAGPGFSSARGAAREALMSGMRHPTISAWQRQEDGSYAAEIDGWALQVRWRPESPGSTHGGHEERRGFLWTAEQAGKRLAAEEVSEEIEVAMGQAEAAIDPRPAVPVAEGAEAEHHGHP